MKKRMHICMIVNPRSGRGKAQRLANAISTRATERGHLVNLHTIGSGGAITAESISHSDRLIIVGGDGTVHHMLGLLSETQTPFYHCGTGTANLICKAFRKSRHPARILDHLETDCPPIRVDLPLCNGHPFLIMTSLGMDASVIHRLEESRTLGGYRAYIKPVIKEILHPRFAHVQVDLDNEHAPALSRPGVLVISNMPNYGGHFNPCAKACWHDQRLDIAHISGGSSITSGLRYLALLARLPAARCASAKQITLTAQTPSCVQVDGEKPKSFPELLAPGQTLDFTMSERSVLVHAPGITNPCPE